MAIFHLVLKCGFLYLAEGLLGAKPLSKPMNFVSTSMCQQCEDNPRDLPASSD